LAELCDPNAKVILTMSRRGMDEARSGFVGHVTTFPTATRYPSPMYRIIRNMILWKRPTGCIC
jgi:hypothetical protein